MLADLAPDLTPELVPKALDAVLQIDDPWSREPAFIALVPKLPDSLLQKAVEATRAMDESPCRRRMLAAIAPRLPEPLLLSILGERMLEDPASRCFAVEAFAPSIIARLPRGTQYRIFHKILRSLAGDPRKEALSLLPALIPFLRALGEPSAVADTARAVIDVCRWWA
jgi:hypothetical protein